MKISFAILSIGAIVCANMPTSLAVNLAAYPRSTRSANGMVTSAHPAATAAGLAILQQGGNAIDAAVATTLAISVVEPFSAGIGGGGFLLVKVGDKMEALDFRERSPRNATRNMFLDAQGKPIPNASTEGYLSVGVPGTIAGMAEVHRRYGKLSWAQVVRPAIILARDGFVVSDILADKFKDKRALIERFPASRRVFTNRGRLWQAGERLRQPDLARTLTDISRDPNSFYRGRIARLIASDMRRNNGLIDERDLREYRPIWRAPLCGNFRQYRVCSMPPPSSGGVHLLQLLNLVGSENLATRGWRNPDILHRQVEAMRIAYADRSEHLGDPAFTNVPVAALVNPAYADLRRREIDNTRARLSTEVRPATSAILAPFNNTNTLINNNPPQRDRVALPQGADRRRESNDTSHLTVVDRDRRVVSLTFTINYRFGSGVVVPSTGILLNDEMDDFAIAPGVPNVFGLVGGEANAIASGKTPLSSMTPTIVTERNQFRLALGAPGGSTIITTVFQTLLNVLEYKMDVGAAVSAGRLHHQWQPDRLIVERGGFDPSTISILQQRGHKIEFRDTWGNANAIYQTPNGILEGAADPRGEGTAGGF